MDPVSFSAFVKKRARELGFDACGITSATAPQTAPALDAWLAEGRHGEMGYLARNADKRRDPSLILPGARSIVALATSYHRPSDPRDPTECPPHSGRVARYAQFADYHDVLAEPLAHLSREIDERGSTAQRSLWYVDTGPILERDVAQRAGLGFAGKHTNLISRRLGNWFFLSEILTTAELAADVGEHNRCGRCTQCLQACPTQAITAPFQLDARRCISYLTIELKGSIPLELRPLIGDRIYGCDDCLAACPWNRFAQEGSLMRPHARAGLNPALLLELLALDEAGFREQFRGSPIKRTKRRGLLRNVCVALGNTAGREALPALARAATDVEPLIAEHARWAMDEILRRHPG